jgi:hypothetical protein
MFERCVKDAKGSYLFCDTDSMSIVASSGGSVACRGGRWKLNNGREGVRALSYKAVKALAKRFRAESLQCKGVREILKIEDINFVGSNPRNQPRQLRAVHKIKEFHFDREMQRTWPLIVCAVNHPIPPAPICSRIWEWPSVLPTMGGEKRPCSQILYWLSKRVNGG